MGASREERAEKLQEPLFYTVAEAAQLLRVDKATIYRAVREDAFPAVRVRSRYVVPAAAVQEMADQATASGACVDVAAMAARRRLERDVARVLDGQTGQG
jgi:excisionase family DNA binding protein